MIYVAHELKQKHIDFIRSKQNWVFLNDYTDPVNQNVMTFDGPYTSLLEGADQLKIPFEVFVFWGNLGTDRLKNTDQRFCTWDETKQLEKYGARLQWHTRTHRRLTEIDAQEQEFDIIPAFECEWFAYPYGDFNESAKEITKKYYRGAVSVIQGNDTDVYCLNRSDIS
jgi:hypothetical protein